MMRLCLSLPPLIPSEFRKPVVILVVIATCIACIVIYIQDGAYRKLWIYKLLMGKRAKPYEPKVYDNAETSPPPDPADPAQAASFGTEPPADPATGAESASAAEEREENEE